MRSIHTQTKADALVYRRCGEAIVSMAVMAVMAGGSTQALASVSPVESVLPATLTFGTTILATLAEKDTGALFDFRMNAKEESRQSFFYFLGF